MQFSDPHDFSVFEHEELKRMKQQDELHVEDLTHDLLACLPVVPNLSFGALIRYADFDTPTCGTAH